MMLIVTGMIRLVVVRKMRKERVKVTAAEMGKLQAEGGARRIRLQERVGSLPGSRAPLRPSIRFIYYEIPSALPRSLGEPVLSLGVASRIYNPTP